MLKFSGSIVRHQNLDQNELLYGKFPSVSINDDGTVVEVYQPHILSTKIYYNVGRLNGEEMNMSEQSTFLDSGRYPKVAINNENHVVEVHEGIVHRYIYYHIGIIEANKKTIDWHGGHVHPLCGGKYPAVAVHGDRVVVTYDRAYGSYTAYYCVGNVTADGNDIEWGERNREIFESYGVAETSVAINEHNVVVAGRGWSSIICRVGRFEGNAIVFTTEIPFSHKGYCPTVCLDNNGYTVMVWQSFTLRKLNYATGKIPNRQQPTIEWPHAQHVPLRQYDYGYNPTIAISPDGTKVLEEHETNYAHRRLYYHTGALEKSLHQGRAQKSSEWCTSNNEYNEQPQKKQDDYFHWWKSYTTSLVIILIVILISILAAKSDLGLGKSIQPEKVVEQVYAFEKEQINPACAFERDNFPDSTTIHDSSQLHQAVVEIGNWRGLCENLKINRGTIDKLKYSSDPVEYKISDCLTAYFDKGEAVWEEVIVALARPTLLKVGLARKIARRYLNESNQAKILALLQSCS